MYKYYPAILGIVDQLNEWNDKLNKIADKYMGNVGVGTLLFFALLGVAFFGVAELNKKDHK